MKNFLKGAEFSQGILAIGYVVFGIILIMYPDVTGTILCSALGICACIYGVIKIIAYLLGREHSGFFRIDLIIGVVFTSLGVFALLQPVVVLSILPVMMGIVIFLDGITKLQRSLTLHKMGYSHWWIILILAIVTACLGLFLIFKPFEVAEMMIIFLGISFILDGLSDIWALFCFSRFSE